MKRTEKGGNVDVIIKVNEESRNTGIVTYHLMTARSKKCGVW